MANSKARKVIFLISSEGLKNEVQNYFSQLASFSIDLELKIWTEVDSDGGSEETIKIYLTDDEQLVNIKSNEKSIVLDNQLNNIFDQYYKTASLVGFQRHLVDEQLLKNISINGNQHISLGMLKNNLTIVDPLFSEAKHLIVYSSVISKYFTQSSKATPFGLTPYEFVQIIKQAGYSENLKNLTLILDHSKDDSLIEIVSTGIWYYLESILQKSLGSDEDIETLVLDHDKPDIVVTLNKNVRRNQSWIQLPSGKKLSCSVSEFDDAKKTGRLSQRLIDLM